MVGRSGQSATEFIVMLGFLTLIGLWIMNALIGPDGNSGAVTVMQVNGATKIAQEKD